MILMFIFTLTLNCTQKIFWPKFKIYIWIAYEISICLDNKLNVMCIWQCITYDIWLELVANNSGIIIVTIKMFLLIPSMRILCISISAKHYEDNWWPFLQADLNMLNTISMLNETGNTVDNRSSSGCIQSYIKSYDWGQYNWKKHHNSTTVWSVKLKIGMTLYVGCPDTSLNMNETPQKNMTNVHINVITHFLTKYS